MKVEKALLDQQRDPRQCPELRRKGRRHGSGFQLADEFFALRIAASSGSTKALRPAQRFQPTILARHFDALGDLGLRHACRQ
jgi:hypothetical protein